MASNSTSRMGRFFVGLGATVLLCSLVGCSHNESGGSGDAGKPVYYTGPMKSQAERLSNSTTPKPAPPSGSTAEH